MVNIVTESVEESLERLHQENVHLKCAATTARELLTRLAPHLPHASDRRVASDVIAELAHATGMTDTFAGSHWTNSDQ